MFEVCVKRTTVSQIQRGRKKELVMGGIIWALYVWLCPALSWLAAPAATWISSRGLWGRGSLMGQTNSSQCEYLHPEIEKIKSYLTMTGRLHAQREATVKYSYAARKAVCAWACACPSQFMQKCAYISQKVCVRGGSFLVHVWNVWVHLCANVCTFVNANPWKHWAYGRWGKWEPLVFCIVI